MWSLFVLLYHSNIKSKWPSTNFHGQFKVPCLTFKPPNCLELEYLKGRLWPHEPAYTLQPSEEALLHVIQEGHGFLISDARTVELTGLECFMKMQPQFWRVSCRVPPPQFSVVLLLLLYERISKLSFSSPLFSLHAPLKLTWGFLRGGGRTLKAACRQRREGRHSFWQPGMRLP